MTTRTETLSALLDTLVDENPAAPIAYDVVAGDVVVSSRVDLRDRAEALRAELEAVGVRPGQCLAVMLPNWSELDPSCPK